MEAIGLTVVVAQNAEGPAFANTQANINALVQALQAANQAQSIVVDPGEFVGRKITDAASFVSAGGVWVSYAGYPFYYGAKATPVYGGQGVVDFLNALGVTLPAGLNFSTPSGAHRSLVSSSSTLPAGWVSSTPIQKGSVYEYPIVGVKAGAGWWFYASGGVGSVTPQEYAAFVLGAITPPPSTTITNPVVPAPVYVNPVKKSDYTPLIIAGGVIALIAGVAIYDHNR